MGTRWRLLRGKVQAVWGDGLSCQEGSGRVSESKSRPTFISRSSSCAVAHSFVPRIPRPLVTDWPSLFCTVPAVATCVGVGFAFSAKPWGLLLVDWPLARYSTKVAYCSCSRPSQPSRVAYCSCSRSLQPSSFVYCSCPRPSQTSRVAY